VHGKTSRCKPIADTPGWCWTAEPGHCLVPFEHQQLCAYDECYWRKGGISYGGAILVEANDVAVRNMKITGGMIGIAAQRGDGERIERLALEDNTLTRQRAWGLYVSGTVGPSIARNHFKNIDRGTPDSPCVGTDGQQWPSGCESAALMLLRTNGVAEHPTLLTNDCTGGANCYYVHGEHGLSSNFNRIEDNTCVGTSTNCFEVTFSTGNTLSRNVTSRCGQSYWPGCSSITAVDNTWGCSSDQASVNADAKACSCADFPDATTCGPTTVL
jgi:parallel beta-helix repeat protein